MAEPRSPSQISQELTSLGIDIGTTTTCLVVSRLTTARQGGVHAYAGVAIIGRELLYRSPVIFTPIAADGQLESEPLFHWVQTQLQAAGFDWGQIDSGAVMITGESAQRQNAAALISHLAERAGRFVVATAGPHLEAVLAGRGAGAARLSRSESCRVLNLDVGGGTTNATLFVNGEPEATLCAHVGGRLVRMESDADRFAPTGRPITAIPPNERRITTLSPPARRLAAVLGLHLTPGQRTDPDLLQALCNGMAEGLDHLIRGDFDSPLAQVLRIEPLPAGPLSPDYLTFSGGVGRELYTTDFADPFRYGDIGPMLAAALRNGPTCQRFPLRQPPETTYATVIGAGLEVLELSGSTIRLAASGLLPLQNLPLIRPPGFDPSAAPDQMATAIRSALTQGTNEPDQPIALVLPAPSHPRFQEVLLLAQGITQGLAIQIAQGLPVIVVLEANIGKVLGNSLAALLPPGHPLICIDQIRSGSGDYIDIGQPLHGGIVVPVVLKSLVFN